MSISRWELACGVVGLLLAGLYMLLGDVSLGFGLVAATIVWTAALARAVDARGVPAGFPKSEARRQGWIVRGLFMGLGVVVVLLVTAAVQGWASTREGMIAVFALVALESSLFVHLKRHTEAEATWRVGAEAETAVASALDQLASEGWLVSHNWPLRRGNVDHVVAGPTGVYAIETKAHHYTSKDYGQAMRGAMAIRETLGGGYVNAVVCVADAEGPAQQKGNVHVVPRPTLADWLRTRPPARVDVPKIAEALRA